MDGLEIYLNDAAGLVPAGHLDLVRTDGQSTVALPREALLFGHLEQQRLKIISIYLKLTKVLVCFIN